MTAINLKHEQGTPEWLLARQRGITGTDIAAILGVHPFQTPLDVWKSKQVGYEQPQQNEAMYWGNVHEAGILARYSADTGAVMETSPPLLQHRSYEWALASVDAFAFHKDDEHPRIVEAKTAGKEWDVIPDHYLAQVAWQRAVTGLTTSTLAALFHGNNYQVQDLGHDQEWEDMALDYAGKWWAKHVVGNVIPPPDPDRDRPSLPSLWTSVPGKTKIIDLKTAQIMQDAAHIRKTCSCKEEYDEAAADVMTLMEDAEEAITPDGELIATWKTTAARKRVDTAAMKADGIYDQYTITTKPGRRFLAK